MYYLQSRYYDPEVGRFVNADVFTSTGQGILGCNMFAYCGNNPINRSDYYGTDWQTTFAVGFTIALVGLVVLATFPFCGPLLAGAGGIAASSTLAAANATVVAGLTVSGGALIQAAFSNRTNPSHSGKPTYNDKEKNERIEYEYYGNGNGNVHYELGRDKTNIWRLTDGIESMSQLPRKIQKIILSNPEMQRAIVKGIDIVKSLAGLK